MLTIFSESDAEIVQELWDLIVPIKEQITETFYEKLFFLDRTIESMFKIDLGEQGIKLTDTLNFVISHMNQIENAIPTIKALGQRHVEYGTKTNQYELVLEALLDTFEVHLGEQFTDLMRFRWIKLYNFVRDIMILGARNR